MATSYSPPTDEQAIVAGSMFGAYRATERIGRGGFSEVWSAWDTRLNRLVAIKLMPRSDTDVHNTIQFGREATVVTRLEHSHILPLYDFGETPRYRYLVMRYVTGGSLAQRIERGKLSTREVLNFMHPIAETLDYIHEQRVIHRDLKPGNILLDAQNIPYLTDFGLAKEISDETRPMHSSSGTLIYMPPEQFSGGEMSAQSDLYSFGIMLYQLFAGTLPYDGKLALGMRQISHDDKMPDITLANPQLPVSLNDMIWQLTDRRSEARPASASAVMQQISALMRDVEADSGPTTASAITLALESGAYRQREAESLLQHDLESWRGGRYTLSLTHFVLLDILLRELPALLTADVRSLMLRAALESNQQIDHWWNECGDSERQQACWHAVRTGSASVQLAALQLAVNSSWINTATDGIVNTLSRQLASTAAALDFIERALPTHNTWASDGRLSETDQNLRDLALSDSPLAVRAATLIGTARRSAAMLMLPFSFRQATPALIAYEAAGSLPDEIVGVERLKLRLMLALRQLTRDPVQATERYLWAAVGNGIAIGLMIYVSLGARADLFDTFRIQNSFGNSVEWGLIYGFAVWLSRHIVQRLHIAAYWLRVLIGIVAGGLVMAGAFGLYQHLVLNGILDPGVAVACGFVYIAGFAISAEWPFYLQIPLGMMGVLAALLIPWAIALQNADFTAPFFFDFDNPVAAIPLAIIAALLMSSLTVGYVWRHWRVSNRRLVPASQPSHPAG